MTGLTLLTGYGAQMAVQGCKTVVSQTPVLDRDLPTTLSLSWAGAHS